MVNLNVGNLSTELYNALRIKKAQLHLNTWSEYLQWSLGEPEGEVDFDFLSVNDRQIEKNGTLPNTRIVFRSGSFVYEFDGGKPKAEQYKLLRTMSQQPVRVQVYAKNHR